MGEGLGRSTRGVRCCIYEVAKQAQGDDDAGAGEWLRSGCTVRGVALPIPATNSLVSDAHFCASYNLTLSAPRSIIRTYGYSSIWHSEVLWKERPSTRHAFLHPPQYARCAATALRPLQDCRDHTEYVRRIAGVSPPSVSALCDA
jgi:hypothetical protein